MWDDPELINILKNGGVAVMPTDTIYGIVGRAEDEQAVKRIYELKQRAPEKPCIILISNENELEKFSVKLTPKQAAQTKEFWSKTRETRPTSIILDCDQPKLSYLHRGTRTLAFRLPYDDALRNLLKSTGPLIAPSANPEGLTPAKDIGQAKDYFGEMVDIYIDGGELKGQPSKIIKIEQDGSMRVLRD